MPVIALSQLNRGPEQRADKKPALSDLRESGSLEQDADMVILLHRESAYEKDNPRAGEADLIVAKHRNGPTRTITVAFHGTSPASPTWPTVRRTGARAPPGGAASPRSRCPAPP